MAGLIAENFKEEILTELSWIMRVLDDLVVATGIETYESTLIKYRVQPEEEEAINNYLKQGFSNIENYSLGEIQDQVAQHFEELTGKPWTMDLEVLSKLLRLIRERLGKNRR